MKKHRKPTAELRRLYNKLVGCVIVRVLWDAIYGQPLPVLILSTPGGGNAECVVFSGTTEDKPGHLRHDV